MPFNDDIIRFTLVHEFDGVATRNDMYLQIANIGSITSLTSIATLLATEWDLVSRGVLSNKVNYEVFAVENLSRNEARGIVTGTGTGLVVDSGHPQDQVLVFTEYGQNDSEEPIRRGRFNLSGVAQQFSTAGRVNEPSEFNDIRLFIGAQFFDSQSGFTANPQTRRRIPASSPPAYTFHRIILASLNPKFFKLKSRKVSLLGI